MGDRSHDQARSLRQFGERRVEYRTEVALDLARAPSRARAYAKKYPTLPS